VQQRQLYHQSRQMQAASQCPPLKETGFRVFSQFEEDGKLLYIFSLLNMSHKTFVEIGADDGINSNAANLYFHFGWNGLFIDGNGQSVERGKRFYQQYPHPWFPKPTFKQAFVTAENINSLISDTEYQGEIGLLSIDIDGNDYWIWKAITIVQPQVVVIETHVEFGLEPLVVPYDPEYAPPGKHPDYHGASPIAMIKLGREKGYRLVGANELGFNFIFLRNGLLEEELPEVPVEEVLQHPHCRKSFEKFAAIKDFEYIRV
jgi:hypothetical protein